MLPIAGARTAPYTEVEGGNLVAFKWEGRFLPALAVSGPAVPDSARTNGVLLLRKAAPPQFYARMTRQYCLDLGKPTFQWSWEEGSISDSAQSSLGQLIVCPEGTLITGFAFQRCAWNITTGAASEPDLTSALFLNRWSVGVMDACGNYQELYAFAGPAPAQ